MVGQGGRFLLEDSNGKVLEKDTIRYRMIGLVETLQKVETD